MQVSGRQITERGRRSKHRSGEEAGDRNTSSVTLAMSVVQKNRQHASRKTGARPARRRRSRALRTVSGQRERVARQAVEAETCPLSPLPASETGAARGRC